MKILDRLVQYTITHFAQEERLLQQHGYPDLAAHKVAHEALKKKVREFQSEFQAGTAVISIELMHFLRNWLEKHIQGTDMRYSPLLIQRRLS
jgi:hemerythrin-like metal-binding protein